MSGPHEAHEPPPRFPSAYHLRYLVVVHGDVVKRTDSQMVARRAAEWYGIRDSVILDLHAGKVLEPAQEADAWDI